MLQTFGLLEQEGMAARDLSYGQQKLLTVACCVALEASLLLLDEPVAGVNPSMTQQMLELLLRLSREDGKTILLIEHNMDAVMTISDRVIALDEGRIIADGKPEEVKANAALVDAYLT
ncbi:MAG: ABC transporter ATP-binding protein [Candidatus Hydrogenedentes bacterium]|nr:ABC transporter ATP-binding protein [Candidatus Hydrogenedentota bacterium]